MNTAQQIPFVSIFTSHFPKQARFEILPFPVVQLNSVAYKLRSVVQSAIDANAGAKRSTHATTEGKSLESIAV